MTCPHTLQATRHGPVLRRRCVHCGWMSYERWAESPEYDARRSELVSGNGRRGRGRSRGQDFVIDARKRPEWRK